MAVELLAQKIIKTEPPAIDFILSIKIAKALPLYLYLEFNLTFRHFIKILFR